MLIHLLAFLDALAALALIGGHYGLIRIPLLYAAIYLCVKIFFFRDILSIIDFAAGLYAIVLLFLGHGVGLTWLFVFWFIYKTMVWAFYSIAS
jgi:hypothetical protein